MRVAVLPTRHRVLSLVAMYGLHALNLALPLVTLPVLARVLGPQDYGQYGLMLTWSAFGAIFVDFGMGISATKELSGAEQTSALGVFARTLTYQTLNAALVLPLVGVAAFAYLWPEADWAAIVLTLACAWAQGLTTLWYRVARANVPELLPATLATKLASLALVVGLLPLRPMLAIALFAYFASHAWAVVDAWRARERIVRALREFNWPAWRSALHVSYAVPLQRIGTSLYSLLPATLAASFFGLKVAGMYVLADRVIRAGTSMMLPMTQTLFPLQLEARGLPPGAAPRRKLRSYVAAAIGLAVTGSLTTLLAADLIVQLVGGGAFTHAAEFLRWMAPLITLVTVNMILTNQLYVQDREPVIARAVWVCGSAFVVVILLFGDSSRSFFGASCMLVEATLTVWLLWAVRRFHAAPAAVVPAIEGVSSSESSAE